MERIRFRNRLQISVWPLEEARNVCCDWMECVSAGDEEALRWRPQRIFRGLKSNSNTSKTFKSLATFFAKSNNDFANSNRRAHMVSCWVRKDGKNDPTSETSRLFPHGGHILLGSFTCELHKHHTSPKPRASESSCMEDAISATSGMCIRCFVRLASQRPLEISDGHNLRVSPCLALRFGP